MSSDWNETSVEVTRGTGPESREWAIREIVADFPNRNGVPDRTREDAELIVDALLNKSPPWLAGWQEPDTVMRAFEVADYARTHGLLHRKGTVGWLRRDGKLLTCTYASHDKLLYEILAMTTGEAEALGWARVARMAWKCAFRLSREQVSRLADLGLAVDSGEEKMKPVWRPPTPVPSTTP